MAEIKIKADSNGGTVSLKGPATTTSNAAVQLTLPVDDGTSGQFLKTDGSGALSWAAAGVDGISSSADATAITIDSSERVGIGLTPAANEGVLQAKTSDNVVAKFTRNNTANYSGAIQFGNNSRTWSIYGSNDACAIHNVTGTQVVLEADTSHNVKINAGNLVIGTSGKGIDFSAGAGSDATSNLLDEYEEGTYTATLKYNNTNDCGFSTSPAGGTDLHYVKVGRLVHVLGYIKGWTMTSGDGSNASITLPFACTGGTSQGPGSLSHYTCFNHGTVRVMAEPSTSRMDFFQDNSTSRTTWSSGTSNYLALCVTYFTDT